MSKGSGLSRGDKNRNQRLGRLRALLPVEHAIVAVDLGERAQAVVVCDHDSRVLARRGVRVGCGSWARCWAGLLGRRGGLALRG